MNRSRHLVLVGLMGSGKTTVGRLLAARLGRPLVDTDELIEATTGRTVREFWRSDGEPAFRVLERNVVVDALAAPEPNVIAAAGGVVLAEETRQLLMGDDITVIWLDADPDVLASRAAAGDHRPLLDDDPEEAMRQMGAARAELYRSVADQVIDVTHRAPTEVVDDIVAAVDGE